MDSEFYTIGLKNNTDKITHHGYHRFYSQYIKKDFKKILEIGIESGFSVNLWLEYCPDAHIYGLDINGIYKNERVDIIQGDQSNIEDLNRLKQLTGKNLDLILDDASHIPEHQLFTFIHLFPNVNHGGIYIIEDIETSNWKKNGIYNYKTNYGPKHFQNILNVFHNILHLLNREFLTPLDTQRILNNIDIPIELDLIDSISTITFCQNCIIIKKKESYEYAYNNRKYRFEHNL